MIQKVSTIFFHLPQEKDRLLTVGSIDTCEVTCQNTAQGNPGLTVPVATGLLTYTSVSFHKEEQRPMVHFLWAEGVKGIEIHRHLSAQYGDYVLL